MRVSRLMGPALLLAVVGLVTHRLAAQAYRGDAVPVVERAQPAELFEFRFLTLAFGREGPMDAPLPTPPVGGRPYLVEADLSGIESVASLRFEFVDTSNRPLQTLTLWKASDGLGDGEFSGFVTAPTEPFRASVSGTTTAGAPFRSLLATLFRPAASGPPDAPILPPGISADQRAQLERLVDGFRQELQARAVLAASQHPGGVIALPRTVVSSIAYEPLSGASGAPVGVRLRYSVQVPSARTIAAVPLVFPVYAQTAWRGLVEMKPLGGTITPAPQLIGAQSLQDVIVYRAAATYVPGVIYTFAVDLVPDYVFQGTLSGRFCLYEQKFRDRAVWDAIKSSSTPVPYMISISDTGTHASIPRFLPQRTFYETFAASGAFDCGPGANIRF
jgi:hypothetical protein